METKKCDTCEQILSIDKFELRSDRGTYRKDCKSCRYKAKRDRRKQGVSKTEVTVDIQKDDATGIITANITTIGSPADPIQYLKSKGIDTDSYTMTNGRVKSWTTSMKLRDKGGQDTLTQIENFGVTANIVPKTINPIEFGLQQVKWTRPESKYKFDSRPKHVENILVLPDIHFGYRSVNGNLVSTHDEKALVLVLKLVELLNPHLIVALGDTLDFPEFGRHPHGVDLKGHTQKSLQTAATFFHDIRELTDCEFRVIEGNHDKRVGDYVREAIKTVVDVPGFTFTIPSISNMLDFDGKNIIYHGGFTKEGFDGYTSGANVWKHRDWIYTHGEKCGKDAIADTMKAYYSNVVMGHIHRQSTVSQMIPVPTDSGIRYKRMWGVCPGMIGKQDPTLPGYGVERNYQQGVTIITHFSRDDWQTFDSTVTQIPFIDGHCFYNGDLLVA